MKKALHVIIKIFIIIIFILSITSSVYFYYQYDQAIKSKGKLNQKEVDTIIASVGKLIDIPKDEAPTVATVTDATKLRQQQNFFKKAQNGDQVLIYTGVKKAILYRPSANKIVDVAPVNIQPNAGESVAGANTTQPGLSPAVAKISVTMYNGTETPGLTYKIETPLTDRFTDVTVASRQASLKKNYPRSMLIDISKKYSAKAKEIANFLNVPVTTLPLGEVALPTDLLIIVGKDREKL